jgi:hypothetical protein
MAFQSKGGQKTIKKQTTKCYKDQFPKTNNFFNKLFVIIRVQRCFVKLQVVLLQYFKSFKMNKT